MGVESMSVASNGGLASTVSGGDATLGEKSILTERQLKSLICQSLPHQAFARQPMRIVGGIALALGIGLGSVLMVILPMPWPVLLLFSVCLGSCYVSLMFFGHELEHGAILPPCPLRSVFQYASLLIFVIPPNLWRFWHNQTHHRHTNVPSLDPDCFRPLYVERERNGIFALLARRLAPGSRHWLSIFSFFFGFTMQAQLVLWRDSRHWKFKLFNRRRSICESMLMVLFWIAITLLIDVRDAVFVVYVPMLVANAIFTAYVSTNHMLRPLVDSPHVLTTTMSVVTLPLFDWLHLHFSHHVEHHLFPNLSHRYYPDVRQLLRRYASESYLAPSHARALYVLLSTPRTFDRELGFVRVTDGMSVSLKEVESRLKAQQH